MQDLTVSIKPEQVYSHGDVFQITETHGRNGWIGAFVMATEIKASGILGFVAHVIDHDEQGHAFIRLKWSEIEFVGRAPLMPDSNQETA